MNSLADGLRRFAINALAYAIVSTWVGALLLFAAARGEAPYPEPIEEEDDNLPEDSLDSVSRINVSKERVGLA